MARCFVAAAPGTGSIFIGAFVPGYQTLAASGAVDAESFNYNITDYDGVALPGFPFGTETAWEVGVGTYSAIGPRLDRNPVFSTNGNLPINASANAQVWCTALASDFVDTVSLAITASGISQATATVLVRQFNVVSNVGPGMSVLIPAFMASQGQRCRIASYGANPLLVWPLFGQSFMSGGVNNGLNEPLTVQAGVVAELQCADPATVFTVP